MWGFWHKGQRKNADLTAAWPEVSWSFLLSLQISALRWGRVSHLPGYAHPRKTAISKDTWNAGKCSFVQNDAGTRVSVWHEIDTTETRFVPGADQARENPGTLADASEADLLNRSQETLADTPIDTLKTRTVQRFGRGSRTHRTIFVALIEHGRAALTGQFHYECKVQP